MEVFYLGLLKYVSVVVYISILGGEEGAESVLSSGSFEGASDGNLEIVGPAEGDPLGIL